MGWRQNPNSAKKWWLTQKKKKKEVAGEEMNGCSGFLNAWHANSKKNK